MMGSKLRISRLLLTVTALTGSLAVGGIPAQAQLVSSLVPPSTTDVSGLVSTSAGTSTDNSRATPFWGNINPFWGNINPFWGNINPFWGNINPFWGNINPFTGDLTQFWGTNSPFYGDIGTYAESTVTKNGLAKPQWSQISTFWQNTGASWVNLNIAWQNGGSSPDYGALAGQLKSIFDGSRGLWGAAVQAQSGSSFDTAFLKPLLSKYGIDLANPNSLATLDPATRQAFFFDYYDGLMNYSGSDHPDWWMKAINWTPAISNIFGGGSRATIGILDFSITGGNVNVVKYDGVSTFSNGHGTAVASLMAAPQDGQGVMGIAPNASVIAYNPFDSTGTASWADIATGVQMLYSSGAHVVNMSLGIKGQTLPQGWNDVFSDARLKNLLGNTIFVTAAGNEGATQTTNVKWNYAINPQIIVVGSVDPSGTISSFSNRPGTACLTDVTNSCKPGQELMNRFIVAPGEWMLVSDGQGGVTRVSGTSFAAPLVSGTIALIQSRWPWLTNHPADVTNIVLKSAKDLGAPGVDPVYGVGELDVQAALSPLDYGKLQWLVPGPFGIFVPVSAKSVQQPSQAAKWEAAGVYFYAFENTGTSFRDFAIPLSTRLFGQKVTAADGSSQYLMDYLYSRTQTWISAGTTGRGFASFATQGGAIGGGDGPTVTMSLAPRSRSYGYKQSAFPYQGSMRLASAGNRMGFRLGYGDGAVALGGQNGLAMISDYDVDAGGANPLLGLASGSSYLSADVALTKTLRVTTGYTEKNLRRDPRTLGLGDLATLASIRQKAAAEHVSVSYTPVPALTVRASYTRLVEANAVLGVRSIDPTDFGRGSTSNGVTIGADLDLGHGLTVAFSGTRAQTHDLGSADRNLRIANGGIGTSSYEVSVAKQRLFDAHDKVRFSLSQPMHVESGTFDFSSVQVIDRQTGELGVVTQSFAVPGPKRQYVGEMMYARSILHGIAGVELFGRAQLRGDATPENVPAVMAGSRLTLNF